MSHNFKSARPLRANRRAFTLSSTFKSRGQDGRMKRIARGIPDQATLDIVLSRINPKGRDMALEMLKPHLDFVPLPPVRPEDQPALASAGTDDSTSGEEVAKSANANGTAQEPTPEANANP